ncbi:hypothetical protein A2U01_0044635, partial [Trifolium medium]|nr:hypothetical protein [Trifolium medium]
MARDGSGRNSGGAALNTVSERHTGGEAPNISRWQEGRRREWVVTTNGSSKKEKASM